MRPCASSAGSSRPRACSDAAGDRSVDDGAHDLLGRAALEHREALRVETARGRRVEHDPAADGRVGAQHHSVAARGDDRLGEPQLGVRPAARDASRDGARPDVHGQRAREIVRRIELHVEPERRRVVAGLDDDVAACDVAPLEAGQVERDALARVGVVDRRVMHVDAAHPRDPAVRLDTQEVARRDASRPERPGGDRPRAGHREHAVHVQPCRTRRRALGDGNAGERGPQVVEARARLRRDRHNLGPGHELARLLHRERERLLVDRVRLRHRDDALVDPEQPQHGEMLVCLRARSLLRVDDEQEEVDARRPGDHRPHEALVAGNVDQGHPAAVRELERRIAEVDRDPAALLLRQPVGVLARQGTDEPRLAVVDVTRGPDRQRHA